MLLKIPGHQSCTLLAISISGGVCLNLSHTNDSCSFRSLLLAVYQQVLLREKVAERNLRIGSRYCTKYIPKRDSAKLPPSWWHQQNLSGICARNNPDAFFHIFRLDYHHDALALIIIPSAALAFPLPFPMPAVGVCNFFLSAHLPHNPFSVPLNRSLITAVHAANRPKRNVVSSLDACTLPCHSTLTVVEPSDTLRIHLTRNFPLQLK